MQRKRVVLAVAVLGLGIAIAVPLASRAAPSPSTPPATKPQDRYTVKLGHLKRIVDADGMLTGVDSLVVRLRPKAFAGPFTIVSAAADGAAIKKGDTLLKLDDAEINRQIAAAQVDLTSATAAAQKTDSDIDLGAKADQQALAIQQAQLKDAQDALKSWTDVDGPHMLKAADIEVENYQAGVDDQQDELDQLRKMYKTDSLTNATEDIVVKRAVRALAMGKEALKISQENDQKIHQLSYPQATRKVQEAVAQATLQLAQLNAAQALALVQRTTAQTAAHAAQAAAQQHLDDLRSDARLFAMTAPFDGTVLYGGIADGAWQGGETAALSAGEKLAPGVPIMTLYIPGKLQALVELPPAQSLWVARGMPAAVTPEAMPQDTYDGTAASVIMIGRPNSPAPIYQLAIDLPPVSHELHPGMRVSAHIGTEGANPAQVLVIPLKALHDGKVSLVGKDGKPGDVKVVVGETDGQSVSIESGLKSGDQIIADQDK